MAEHRASGLPPAAKPAYRNFPKQENHNRQFLRPKIKLTHHRRFPCLHIGIFEEAATPFWVQAWGCF